MQRGRNPHVHSHYSSISRSIAGRLGLPVYDDILLGQLEGHGPGRANDRRALMEIAKSETHRYAAMSAFGRIDHDISSLSELAFGAVCTEVVQEAVLGLSRRIPSITDPEALKLICSKSSQLSAKRAAARRLAEFMHSLDSPSLRAVYAYSDSQDEREKALARLSGMAGTTNDAMALKLVCVHSTDKAARRAALKRLESSAQNLAFVACNSSFSETRLSAVRKLETALPGYLAQVAIHGFHDDAVLSAVSALAGNKEALKAVAKEALKPETRRHSIALLTKLINTVDDPTSLRMIIQESSDAEVATLAAQKMAGKLDALVNDFDIIYVAMFAADAEARRRAVGMLAGKHGPLAVVRNHSRFDDAKALASELIGRIEAS